ncbi:MAG: M23 family metallopeptidase [Azonexaceae bacterium]|nr:M23 family metallopeptidase [Azonexaceae bacterium]
MRLRVLIAAAISLFCQAAFPGQNDNYPFSVDSEKTPYGHRIVARNSGPAPVSVKVSLIDAQYISTDRQFPLFVVVPPGGGTLYLGEIHPAMSGVGYTFRTQYTWTLGDFNAAQSPDAIYRLPYRDGTTFRIGQSPGGPVTTHTSPDSQFAVDIPMPEGTPVLAAREGTVIYTEANQVYGAQVPDMMGKANEVRIQHIDGTFAVYAYLSHGGVYVYPGQRVAAGQQIGLAGSTGYSSGPHLHFAVQAVRKTYDKIETVSLPFQFYVGNPPVAFAPQFNLLAKADYSAPGVIPGTDPTQVARSSQTIRSQPATGNPELVVSIEVPTEIRSYLLRIQSWKWFSGLVALVMVIVWLDKLRTARRQRELRIVREPTIRSRPAEEPIFHGLTPKDKLIISCSGDRQRAEQLLEIEYQRSPNINQDEAAIRAWERLQNGRA